MKIASVYIPRVARALLLTDIVVVVSVLSAAVVFSHGLDLSWMNGLSALDVVKFGLLIGFVTLFILVCNFAMGLYQRRFMRGRKLVHSLTLCAVIGLVALLFMDNLFLQNSFTFWQLGALHMTIFMLIGAMRPIVCSFFENFVPKKRLALVGSDMMAERVRWAIDSVSPSDAVLVDHYGFDASTDNLALGATLETACSNPNVDEVFVEMAAPDLEQFAFAGQSGQLNSTHSLFDRYMRFVDNEMVSRAESEALVIKGHSSFWAKRILETAVSAVVMLFFLPIIIAAVIAIKLEDGGSLFYKQTRVGKNGKLFSVLKFRSMIENAEKAGAPQWAKVGDSRVTRVGSFLRKSRIDELPQLLNVIKGDMALVGPRPERPEFVAELSKEIPNFDLRHVVRPGLTGWAQISYPYGASIEDARWKTRFDLYYINNWTIWFDIAIIAQTVRVVLLAEGSR